MDVEAGAVSVPDLISLGVLTSWVSRDAVDVSIGLHGRHAKRRGGSLPPNVMMYYVPAMAIHADQDYEGVMRKLTEPMRCLGNWDPRWKMPTSGGITQARARLGFEPVKELFERIAFPVADVLTPGAFCAGRRVMSIDGMVFDLPDTEENTAEFGKPSGGVFPQARVVTLNEAASHAEVGGWIGPVKGKGSGERTAALELVKLLEPGQLLVADQGFYSFELWCQAAEMGADLLWRIGDILNLPVVTGCGDGSYLTVLFDPRVGRAERARILETARAGRDLDACRDRARLVRVVEYDVPDRGSGELICLLSTILGSREAPAQTLAECYHLRWEHEGANKEIKSSLRGPGKILRSKTPDMVRQEIYGYLIAHYALSALICTAATETGIDSRAVQFTRTVRIVGDRLADPDAFSP